MRNLVDFHTHILPGIDDGSPDAQTSLAMLRKAWEQGIETVVATPHFYPQKDDPQSFLTRRAAAEALLREYISEESSLPQLKLGAEVYYFPGISDSDMLSKMTVSGTNCVLVEMPSAPWSEFMYRELEGICLKQGLTPIIAHIDRYISPFWSYGILKRLGTLPVLVQANASFFLARSTRRLALKMVREKKIHLLGSDCHDLIRRPPDLADAVSVIEDRLGPGSLEYIDLCGKEVFRGNSR